ncbi:hypothetical protein [Asticcacaulis sp. EMRT-3]|uniref:hypothetical protein n=1 Tax=Asticcacaulis sp. EMRT-3 TaxID=3040349 RepID=UPI0024AFBE4E|nr:hypothetical protein [Asticcacaulis sp. EMRT-3]MDI7774342.1 hypothetical protein [Asticcacaulis sp. EMRT-3]
MRRNAVMIMGVAGLGLGAMALAGCTPRVQSPDAPGVCYFIGHPTPKENKFNVLATNVPDLEHCAVYVYNARMDMLKTGTAGPETDGAYMGNFLFADNHEVRSGQHYEGPAFPFLVKAPDGRLVAPGSIVQDDGEPTGPQSVNIPKDLPKISSGDKK